MISPYKNKINSLKKLLIEHIEDVDYFTADESFDNLASMYFLEFIFYSRVLDEEIAEGKDQNILKGTLEELTSLMDNWREMIEMQAKWGTIR
jgi:hypothetical protein